MSGKPAARQNDMTAEGGPIVQGLREGGANTGIQKLVDSLISERGQSTGKKLGRCEMLEELIADGRFTALETSTP
nr:polymorphic toxin type 34 domain-containing protein [Salmonella enterica]